MTAGVWDHPGTVAGFELSPPNPELLKFAERLSQGQSLRVLDIGCGAGRNAVPLAGAGHAVVGVDRSVPMLEAARRRAAWAGVGHRTQFLEAEMQRLEVEGPFDLVVAHGIWNLAVSDAQFLEAVREAARVTRPGAGLFVFTFSRHTLGPLAAPVPGQRWTHTQFSGQPQVFLTASELTQVLAEAGFSREGGPLTEYNRQAAVPPEGRAPRPVLWEGCWHRFDPLV